MVRWGQPFPPCFVYTDTSAVHDPRAETWARGVLFAFQLHNVNLRSLVSLVPHINQKLCVFGHKEDLTNQGKRKGKYPPRHHVMSFFSIYESCTS